MDPLLTSAIVMFIAVVIATVAITMKMRQSRERSYGRVEVLRALVEESGYVPTNPRTREPENPTDLADDWDLRLHAEGYDDVPEYDDEPEPVVAPAAARAAAFTPAAPTQRAVATTPQFVVNLPDSDGTRPWQVSFQQRESRS